MSGEKVGNDDIVQNTGWESLSELDKKVDEELKDDLEFIEHKYKGDEAKRKIEERKALRGAEKENIKKYEEWLEKNESRSGDAAGDSFEGETNVNSGTGKERTFTTMDTYNIGSDETAREYGDRIINNGDIEVLTGYLPMLENESAEEYSKRIKQVHEDFPRKEGESLKEYRERMKEADEDNKLLESCADHVVDPESKAGQYLRDEFLNIEDMQKSGRFGDEKAKAFRREVLIRSIEQQKKINEAEEREKRLEELRKKKEMEDGEKRKLEDEEKRKLEDEEAKKAEQEKLEEQKEEGPLVAINADMTLDARDVAYTEAATQFDAEMSKAGFLERIWKKGLFERYYKRKYEKEILSGARKIEKEGVSYDLSGYLKAYRKSAMERFIKGATESADYIHDEAGEKLVKADGETTEAVKSVIEKFAGEWAENNAGGDAIRDNKEIRQKFYDEIKRLSSGANNEGLNADPVMLDNYFDIAIQASERAAHGVAMERVLDGFEVYNAEVRDGYRTKVHRDAIDKITDKIAGSKIGRVIPAEVVAAALGTIAGLTQTGGRALGGTGVGILISGLIAGFKEREQAAVDRAIMTRNLEQGNAYSGTSNEEVRGFRAKRIQKYEKTIGGTVYEMKQASDLISNISEAMEGDDAEARLRAIAEARVRIGFSDSEGKALIAYSSEDKMSDERLQLDIAVIEAEKSLSEEDREKVEEMKKTILNEMIKDVDEKDKDFKKTQAVLAIKKAAKSVAIGAAFAIGSQELMAALDPNKIGLFEKLGILKTRNNDRAAESLLARLAGPERTTQTITVSGDNEAAMRKLEAAGYDKTQVSDGWIETKTDVINVNASDSASGIDNLQIQYANYNTNPSELNELRLYRSGDGMGFRTNFSGNSVMGNRVINTEELVQQGRITGILQCADGTYVEIPATGIDPLNGNPIFSNLDGSMTTASGGIVSNVVGSDGTFHGGRFFAGFFDNDGSFVSLASFGGDGSGAEAIQEAVTSVLEHQPTYVFSRVFERVRALFGAPVIPDITPRAGLGATRVRQEAAPGEGNGTEATPEEPAPEAPVPESEPEPEAENPTEPEATTPVEPTPTNVEPVPIVAEPTSINGVPVNSEGTSVPSSAEATPADNTNEVVAETTAEAAPTQPETDNSAEEWNDLGREFLTSEEGLSEEYADRISEWWAGLSEDLRNDIREYFDEVSANNPHGRALREWLSLQ